MSSAETPPLGVTWVDSWEGGAACLVSALQSGQTWGGGPHCGHNFRSHHVSRSHRKASLSGWRHGFLCGACVVRHGPYCLICLGAHALMASPHLGALSASWGVPSADPATSVAQSPVHPSPTAHSLGCLSASGIPASKLVEAHGTFASATCTVCRRSFPGENFRVGCCWLPVWGGCFCLQLGPLSTLASPRERFCAGTATGRVHTPMHWPFTQQCTEGIRLAVNSAPFVTLWSDCPP